jgi:hypothetical protein
MSLSAKQKENNTADKFALRFVLIIGIVNLFADFTTGKREQ